MKLFARDALLPTGWAHDVLVDVAADGSIRAVDVAFAAPVDAERLQGPLVPGISNVHSHAFQRALAGLTERGGPSADNFWTWRTQMYRFLERVGPDEQEAVAAQLYVELSASAPPPRQLVSGLHCCRFFTPTPTLAVRHRYRRNGASSTIPAVFSAS
jgi:cytosine/adenosine deaminase-related metal-dependent hydrolase